ncbi:MAG: hypothetical protein ACOY6E_12935 [Pseudomonadota bacterium]|jgi:hypothetical protein
MPTHPRSPWILLTMLMAPVAYAAADAAAPALTDADQTAAFTAAGATRTKDMWTLCADDPNTIGARIETVADVNGDGLPDAVIVEESSFCYGFSGVGYAVISKLGSGEWRLMSRGSGVPEFLDARGADGWPDLLVGGPGFCGPVERWDGKQYALNRFEYDGKPCSPPR